MSEFDAQERPHIAREIDGAAARIGIDGLDVRDARASGREAGSREEPILRGELCFADAGPRAKRAAELAIAGALVVNIAPVQAAARGRLGDVIDDAIERELSARGAAPPGVGASSDSDSSLGDQLFRARRIGAKGICVSLAPLRAIQGAVGALEPEDSATLRFFASATRERPVALLLDAVDARTPAFGDPVPLAVLMGGDAPHVAPSAPPAMVVRAPVLASAPVAIAPPAARVPHPDRQRIGASVADPAAPWRTWVLQLVAARGPQPLAAFERLFANSYLPLANAIAEGLDDPRAVSAHEEFRRTFERAYTEACPTFAVTGKRPRLVLDVPEIASRTARLHGARTVHLVLVDGMRFDLGAMVKADLARALDGRASLTDEHILWSALPTITTRQLEGIARGIEALRSTAPPERDVEVVRGRTAEIVRRMKVGTRDLFKLDLVESKLKEAGGGVLPALPDLARAVATILARHTEHLPARTLLVIFGDHGFALDDRGAATQGGASPEEVLVPAFTFLVGDVH